MLQLRYTILVKHTAVSASSRLQSSNCAVESHGFDIQRTKDGFLVNEVLVVNVGLPRRQYDAHFTQVDVHRPQICSI